MSPWVDYQALRRRVSMERVLELMDYRATSRRGVQLRGLGRRLSILALDREFESRDNWLTLARESGSLSGRDRQIVSAKKPWVRANGGIKEPLAIVKTPQL